MSLQDHQGHSKWNRGRAHSSSLNVTLKDLNKEATRILRTALLKDKVKRNRNEGEVFVSGHRFPCEDYKVKKSLLRNATPGGGCIASSVKKTRAGDGKLDVEKYSLVSEKNIKDVNNFPSDDVEATPKRCDHVILTGESGNKEARVSSASKPQIQKGNTSTSDEEISKSEELQSLDVIQGKQTEDTQDELGKSPVLQKSSECTLSRADPALAVSDNGRTERISMMPEQDENVTKTKDCVIGNKEDEFENTRLLRGHNHHYRSSSLRRNSQLGVRSPSGGSLSFERRRLSSLSSRSRTTKRYSRGNYISSSDEFALDNILNPLLRESLKKILNPQSYVEDNYTEDNTEDISTSARRNLNVFEEEENFLPNIQGALMYKRFGVKDQKQWSFVTKRSSGRGRSPSCVLYSTKCPEIVVSSCRPEHMISTDSSYAVTGLIGQWLKGRSVPTVGGMRETSRAEKQETFREVQLLKVGLSMKMLAGIV